MRKMRIKTKEDALLHCFDMWLWLALNPTKDKSQWPGFATNGGYLKLYNTTTNCPICELNVKGEASCISDDTENNCIIKWKTGHCNRKGSEFYSWNNKKISKRRRTELALRICALSIEALE